MQSPPSSLSVFPFVGDDRKKIVKGLANVYQQVQATGKVHWVSLEAESGWGKTRIVHQFYEHLASLQSSRYWPPEISYGHDFASSKSIETRRKLTHPDYGVIDREAGSLPEFMWLGIDCAFRNGLSQDELLADIRQLEMHKIYLAKAWSDAHSMGAQVQHKFKKLVDTLLDEGVAEGLQQVGNLSYDAAYDLIEQGAHAVPGLGIVVRFLRDGVKKAHTMQVHQRIIDEAGMGEQLDAENALIEQITQTIQAFSCREIPFVIVIEDLHRANERLKKLLEALVQSSAHILIISTSWCSPQLDAFLTGQTITRFDHLLRIGRGYAIPPFFDPTLQVTTFKHDQVKRVVAHFYPDTTATELTEISKHFTNPFALELFFGLKKNKRKLGGAIELGEDLGKLKTVSVERMYQAQWDELGAADQLALSLAAASVPDDQLGWHLRLVSESIDQMLEKGELEAHTPVNLISVGYDWSIALSGWMYGVVEAGRLDFIKSSIDKGTVVDAIDLEDFYQCLADRLRLLDWNKLESEDLSESLYLHKLAVHLYRQNCLTVLEVAHHINQLFSRQNSLSEGLEYRGKLAELVLQLDFDKLSGTDHVALLGRTSAVFSSLGDFAKAYELNKRIFEDFSIHFSPSALDIIRFELLKTEFKLGHLSAEQYVGALLEMLESSSTDDFAKIQVHMALIERRCQLSDLRAAQESVQAIGVLSTKVGLSQNMYDDFLVASARVSIGIATSSIKNRSLSELFNSTETSSINQLEKELRTLLFELEERYEPSEGKVSHLKHFIAEFLMHIGKFEEANVLYSELLTIKSEMPNELCTMYEGRASKYAMHRRYDESVTDFCAGLSAYEGKVINAEYVGAALLAFHLEKTSFHDRDAFYSLFKFLVLIDPEELEHPSYFYTLHSYYLKHQLVKQQKTAFIEHLVRLVQVYAHNDEFKKFAEHFYQKILSADEFSHELRIWCLVQLGESLINNQGFFQAATYLHFIHENFDLDSNQRTQIRYLLASCLIEINQLEQADKCIEFVQDHVSSGNELLQVSQADLDDLRAKYHVKVTESGRA